jgi:serine/threonine protein kinase
MAQARVGTQCPECGRRLRLDPQLIGTTVRCPACRKTFVVSTVSFAESAGPGKTSGEKASTEKLSGTKAAGGAPPSVPEAELSLEAFGTRMISGDSTETFAGKKSGSGELSTSTGKIGRFEVHEVLGRGAFGVVSRAYDRLLDRQVALKVPLFSSKDGKRAKRFLNEAKAAARLRHPNIVAVYEGGEADGKLYLAAEYIKGQTLAEVIKSARPVSGQNPGDAPRDFEAAEHHGCGRVPHLLPIEQSARWVRELAGALAYAHAQGVVHRDIKPHNVMIDGEGRPQIMDFGLAKRVDQDSKMTSEGALLGTPAYMPPEQARGDIENVGPHSDQYSLGAVLYELLTGQRPFDGPPAIVIAKAASEEPPAPRTINSAIPQDLEAICLKAMEKDPARRYANCVALAADLDHWLRGESVAARPPSRLIKLRGWRRRQPLIAALTGAVALLLVASAVGGGVAWLTTWQSRDEVAGALSRVEDQTARTREKVKRAAEAAEDARAKTATAEREAERALAQRQQMEETTARLQTIIEDKAKAEKRLDETIAERKAADLKAQQAAGRLNDANKAAETAATTVESARHEKYISLMAAAQKALDERDFARIGAMLEDFPKEYRGWEWHYLNAISQTATDRQGSWIVSAGELGRGGLSTIAKSYSISGSEVETSQSGKILWSREAPFVYVWDIERRGEPRLLLTVKPPFRRNGGFATSADDTMLAQISIDREEAGGSPIRTIEIRGGKSWQKWKPPEGRRAAVESAIRPGPKSMESLISIYNEEHPDGKRLRPSQIGIFPHRDHSPDGTRSASLGDDLRVHILDVPSKREVLSIPSGLRLAEKHDSVSRQAAWSGDGKRLFVKVYTFVPAIFNRPGEYAEYILLYSIE